MTREEAIMELKRNIVLTYIDPFTGEISEWLSENSQRYVDACKLAIEALEQEPYEDAKIQKMQELEQAAIVKAYEWGKASQPKIGHWIKKKPYPMLEYDYECSECGHDVIDKTPYCPSCGAKMEREAKENAKG